MNKLKIAFLSIFLSGLLFGCVTTTALYGNEFEKVSEDVYTLKIFWGGPPPAFVDFQKVMNDVDNRLDKEAKKFMQETNQYSSYEILERTQQKIGSAFTYKVKFKK